MLSMLALNTSVNEVLSLSNIPGPVYLNLASPPGIGDPESMLLNAFPMNTGDNIDFATILCTLLPLTLPFTVLFMLLQLN